MKKDKAFIEKFKEFDVYYDKKQERFIADSPNKSRHFEGRTLWEIKGYIRDSRTKDVNKDLLIVSGYFDKAIARIKMTAVNDETKRCKYKVIETTEGGYDTGRTFEDEDYPETFEPDEHNMAIYNEVKKLEEDIKKIEAKQNRLVEQLK